MEQPVEEAESITARLLGHSASLRPQDVSADAGVPLSSARAFWHALGFPLVEDDEAVFTQADARALKQATDLTSESGVEPAIALAMTRAFARTTDRLAVWQTQLMAEALTPPEQEAGLGEKDARTVTDRAIALAAGERLADLADAMEPLLVYAWRRHLVAAIDRMAADADPGAESAAGTPVRVIGFADLVNFTALVRRMTERQLAVMVQRFEVLATDVITAHGGRVIKTVGDEVLFVHTEPSAAAAIALDLVEGMTEEELLPDVRVAMAYGPVLSRLGDVFGTTVNRASRMTAVTPPGKVWVDDALTRRLASTSGFAMRTTRRRNLRGIGAVTPSELSRALGTRPREETS